MKFGSLFSGIGGFDLGFERVGMSCAWQVEIDEKCNQVLEKHWTGVKRYKDVREVGRQNLEAVDVICGGFPCQDLSVAGKRAGLAGERSGLWFEFARVINELEPKWVVIENVPGLLSSHRGRDFAVIIRWLAERGYGVAWRVLDAQYFGVAQRRRRVFIVGSLGNGRAAEVLFEREGVRWNPPQRRKAGEEVAGTIDAKSASSNRGSQANEHEFIVMAHGQANAEILQDQPPTLSLNHEQPIAFTGRGYGHDATQGIAPTMRSLPDSDGHQAGSAGLSVVWDFHQQDGSYRPQDETSPTVAAKWGTGGNNMPFVGVRRLTPKECERLQGFPDGWTDGQADSSRYKQLGNAVCVPVAEWIARRIVETEQEAV